MANPPVVFADPIIGTYRGLWDSTPGTFSATGGRGGRGLYTCNNGPTALGLAAHTRCIMALALYPHDTNNDSFDYLIVGGVTIGLGNYLPKYGSAQASRSLQPNAWNHLAVAVYRDTSSGTVDIWLNETNILSLTGQNTGSGGSSQYKIAITGAGRTGYGLSDIFIAASDTATDAPYGDRAVLYLKPTGAGTHADWSLGGGASSDWSALASVPAGAGYISSSTVGNRDTMAMADLPSSMGSIDAVLPVWNALKTDAGTRAIAPTFRIGGTDYDGTGQNLSMSAQLYEQVYMTSPATSSAWGIAEVNGLEAGVKLSA